MPNPQPGQMEQRMEPLAATDGDCDWCHQMSQRVWIGAYNICRRCYDSRPTPDGEIGELVAYLHDEARSYAAKLTPMTVCAARDDGYRPPLPEETTFWKAATALETQAADITRLREAAERAEVFLRDCVAEPSVAGAYALNREANALSAALATRTDVR